MTFCQSIARQANVKATFFLLLVGIFSVGPLFAAGDATKSPVKSNPTASSKSSKGLALKSTQVLMQDKLSHAQSILRGVAMEDFQSIVKDTEMLAMIAKAASWYNTDSPDYMRYFKNFEESVAFLEGNAKSKNLEGVAMGYVRLTLSCMQCHNFVREHRSHQ